LAEAKRRNFKTMKYAISANQQASTAARHKRIKISNSKRIITVCIAHLLSVRVVNELFSFYFFEKF